MRNGCDDVCQLWSEWGAYHNYYFLSQFMLKKIIMLQSLIKKCIFTTSRVSSSLFFIWFEREDELSSVV